MPSLRYHADRPDIMACCLARQARTFAEAHLDFTQLCIRGMP